MTQQQQSRFSFAAGGATSESTELQTQDFSAFQSIYSTRRPRDLLAGLSSGSKSIAKGLLAGTLCLVGTPIVGAIQGGWVGLAKGVATGVLGAVVLPVIGVGVGISQTVRGAWNTPLAIMEASKGKHWDKERREWVKDPGMALIASSDAFSEERERWRRGAEASTSGAQDGDMDSGDFYELLGVSRHASAEEIKRQYFIMARRMHPDKNPGDPLAKERFQKLAEAYQVLGDADLRRRYDDHGVQGLDVNFMDACEFFTMLFGSDKFHHLIGELMCASAARTGGEFSYSGMKRMQAVRIEELTVMLKALLRRWVEGDQEGFQESMQEEGKMLAASPYGPMILQALARVYDLQADIYLGGLVNGTVAGIKSKVNTVQVQLSAAKMAFKILKDQMKMETLEAEAQLEDRQRISKGRGKDGAEQVPQDDPELLVAEQRRKERRERMQEASLPLMLEALWAANVVDIESTVRGVCQKTLGDASISKPQRRLRAEGLKALATIFGACAEAGLQAEEPLQAKDKVEEAMKRVMEKRANHHEQ